MTNDSYFYFDDDNKIDERPSTTIQCPAENMSSLNVIKMSICDMSFLKG